MYECLYANFCKFYAFITIFAIISALFWSIGQSIYSDRSASSEHDDAWVEDVDSFNVGISLGRGSTLRRAWHGRHERI